MKAIDWIKAVGLWVLFIGTAALAGSYPDVAKVLIGLFFGGGVLHITAQLFRDGREHPPLPTSRPLYPFQNRRPINETDARLDEP